MRVAIIGASGYTGLELVRLVLRHPELELTAVTSEQRAGQALGEAFPSLRSLVDGLVLEKADAASLAGRVDVAFTCVAHATAAPLVAALRGGGVTVVDISADFRLRDPETYEAWYGPHGAPEIFSEGVYGLPEIYRDELAGAKLAAAPGCYPTASLLPMIPLLRAGVAADETVIVDAKSGASGAGRTLKDDYLLVELAENAYAYKVANHRHAPEIEQEASVAAGREVRVTFVPQLIPAMRGILSSVYLRPAQPITTAEARAILEDAYRETPFVRVVPDGETPSLANVRGSNFCDVGVQVDPRHGTIVALGAIDNLTKGAVGQGVQCLNLMQRWDETLGLLEAPLAP